MQITFSQVMDTVTIYVEGRMFQMTEAEAKWLTTDLNSHFATLYRTRKALAARNDLDVEN